MNILSFHKTFGRFSFYLDVLGALALGVGLNFFPHVIGIGISLGPFVVSLSYNQPHEAHCAGGTCQLPTE